MNRDDTVAFACGSICLQVHPVLPLAMKGVSVAVGPLQAADVVTWLAKGARFLTLVKTQHGTRVYDHADDLMYYANPNTELPGGFPDDHALLCQTVCDRQPDGTLVPRLLVMDLVAPPIECPKMRGEALRKLGPHLPHTCHLQWAGEQKALQAFIAQVPHDVETLVALRGPLQLVREPPPNRIAILDALELMC